MGTPMMKALCLRALPKGKMQWVYSQWCMREPLLAVQQNKQPIKVALLDVENGLEDTGRVKDKLGGSDIYTLPNGMDIYTLPNGK